MCEVTSDGDVIIGRARPRNNPLIQQSVVGKPSYRSDMPDLPPGHTFGAALKRDPEGAGEVMLSWHSGTGTHRALDGSVARNKSRNEMIEERHFVADTERVYGRPSGDASKNNMASLLQNRYELEWVNEQRQRHEAKARADNREKQRKALPTRISIERNERMQRVSQTATKPHPKEYYTLSQFRNVPSRYATPSPTSAAKGYFSPASRTRIDCDQFSKANTSAQAPTSAGDYGYAEGEEIPQQHDE